MLWIDSHRYSESKSSLAITFTQVKGCFSGMFWDVLIQYNHRSGPTAQMDALTIGQSQLPWLRVNDKK